MLIAKKFNPVLRDKAAAVPEPKGKARAKDKGRPLAGGGKGGAEAKAPPTCYQCGKRREDHPNGRFCPRPAGETSAGASRGRLASGLGEAGLCASDLGAPLGALETMYALQEHLRPG